MREYIRDFLLIVQFLTRIPIRKSLPCEKENFRRGAIFFPIIGLIVGGLQFGVSVLFSKILPTEAVAILAIMAGVLITGSLHLDGWGDVFDGFFSFKGGKDKIIEIMKDSRIGTYAGVALICNILFKYSLITFLIEKGLFVYIILPPVIGRWAVVFISYMGRSAKKTGSGNIFIGNMDIKRIIITTIITFAIMFPITKLSFTIIILAACVIIIAFVNLFCNHYIVGLTGDTLGFTNEVIEMFTLAIMCVSVMMNWI